MSSQRDKFVIAELFSNEDGKTSASGFVGIMVGIVGCLAFITATVGYVKGIPNSIEVMQQSSIFIGSAVALLAARKFSPRRGIYDSYGGYDSYDGGYGSSYGGNYTYASRNGSTTGSTNSYNSLGDSIADKPRSSNDPEPEI
jgi:hypothetical protein